MLLSLPVPGPPAVAGEVSVAAEAGAEFWVFTAQSGPGGRPRVKSHGTVTRSPNHPTEFRPRSRSIQFRSSRPFPQRQVALAVHVAGIAPEFTDLKGYVAVGELEVKISAGKPHGIHWQHHAPRNASTRQIPNPRDASWSSRPFMSQTAISPFARDTAM